MLPDQLEKPGRTGFADRFAAALTDPTHSTPMGVIGPHGKGAVTRYNVYRNNVTVSLINALAAIYPAIQRITGIEFFRAMARFHVRAHPADLSFALRVWSRFPCLHRELRICASYAMAC